MKTLATFVVMLSQMLVTAVLIVPALVFCCGCWFYGEVIYPFWEDARDEVDRWNYFK